MKKSILYLLFVIFAFLSGCATHHTQDMLNSRMYKMNFEEAIKRFGPPSKCAESGSTKICDWDYGGGGAVIMPFGTMAMAVPVQSGPDVRLTFTNDKLTYYQLYGDWD